MAYEFEGSALGMFADQRVEPHFGVETEYELGVIVKLKYEAYFLVVDVPAMGARVTACGSDA
ncbi:hypothetical protein KV205_35275 [Streptomyces sp. SKN60]|uniref:hypothetical protein n=1 Tax=Streptomyces sp. SKN60 TaxID=2855506 RepID=UPI0022456B06|nr:hypothetical protein [Streptomyces sp. SKN60]MCX2185728.1 hypothetical protein [Streptomyces sp. SKN60]